MDTSHVYVTGMGAVTCLGIGSSELFKASLENKSGITQGLGKISPETILELQKNYPEGPLFSLSALLSYASIKEAMKDAGWDKLDEETGLILATTTGQITLWENELIAFLKGEKSEKEFSKDFESQPLGSILEVLSKAFQFKGPSLLVTSACSASTQAIALGSIWIKSGKVKRCLVGGVEVLSQLTVEGFRSLQLLSEGMCKSFDTERAGINLAEGAGFLCLEKDKSRAWAEVSGYGFSSDAYHLTSPLPEGEGSLVAMSKALREANLSPKDIQWVFAHGTGSKANDDAEGKAIQELFKDQEAKPYVSSTKGIHGHTLAASGAVETILCLKALSENVILKTPGLVTPENPALNHPTKNIHMPYEYVLKNTLGFGGNNASLVLKKGTR
jgi:3-oxoacyl-(acyl-carrier-protein) synthase